MAVIGWDSFKALALKDFVTHSHIDIDVTSPIAEVIDNLNNLGFQPRDFLTWSNCAIGEPLPVTL